MNKYLLTDSLLVYMKEKFLYDINEEYYINFEKSIECEESIIVSETMRNLSYIFLDDNSVKDYEKMFLNVECPDNSVIKSLVKILNSDNCRNYLNELIRYGRPTPLPFIIATACNKQIPIVVDTTANDYEITRKLCEEYCVSIFPVAKYLKAI